MADNTQLNANTTGGDLIATDDITDGGVADSAKVQRVKQGYGIDNAYTDVNHVTPFPIIPGLTDPQSTHDTVVSVAAGVSGDCESNQITSGKTGELVQLIIGASVPWKGQLKLVANGVETTALITFFGRAGKSFFFTPLSKKLFRQAQDAGAGFDGFRVTMTNLDTSQAADVYATFIYDEV